MADTRGFLEDGVRPDQLTPGYIFRTVYNQDPIVRASIDMFMRGKCDYNQALMFAILALVREKKVLIDQLTDHIGRHGT